MNSENPKSPATRSLRSFAFAFRGLALLLRTQPNARIHAVLTALVLLAGAWLRIERWEWCILLLAAAAVWVAEALNTSFEELCNVASPEFHPQVERAKDVAAGAVLIAAAAAAAAGAVIFLPHLIG